jgi:uncharacterized protein (TIRG00374 family)
MNAMELLKQYFFRVFLLAGIFVAFVYYIVKNMPVIISTFNVTAAQSLPYILLTLIFSALGFAFTVLMNQKVFAMLGVSRTKRQMFALLTSALAVNVLVPTGGLSTGVMFVQDAKKRGESGPAVISALTLALLANYLSIVVLLVFAMIYLSIIGSLKFHVIIPAAIFFLLTFGLFLLIFLAGKNKIFLAKILKNAVSLWRKFIKIFRKKETEKRDIVTEYVGELEGVYQTMLKDPKDLYKAVSYIFLSHFFYLASLYVLFASLGLFPHYRIIISGYAIGMMFVVISPTPNGVGFVEGSMVLAYTSLGLPSAAAATVSLIYRGFSFWLPMFLGFVFLQKRHLTDILDRKKT